MKNVVSALFVTCVVTMAAGVAAQGNPNAEPSQPGVRTQQPATGTQQPTTGAQAPTGLQREAEGKITISGCIQNAPAAQAGAATASAEASKFILTNAKMAGNARSAVGTSGTTTATRYRLEGEDKTLTPHLNQQVEITGMIQNSSASASGAPNATSAAAGPMLKVDSVKMVAAKCQ